MKKHLTANTVQGQALIERLDSFSHLDSSGYAPALVRYVSFKEKETAVCGFVKPDKKLNKRNLKLQ